MGVLDNARKTREMIELAIQHVPDNAALDFIPLHPAWSPAGVAYREGKRIRHQGQLYRVAQDHQSREEWSPEAAPSLFSPVIYQPEEPDPPEDAEAPKKYMIGDEEIFGDKLYESLIDNNVWTPEEYPQGWKEIDQ